MIMDKKEEVVLFSSTAIALYGYDQGMMSLINTNQDYLNTMGIGEKNPLVGVIVSVYYLGCAVGSVLASLLADRSGRKVSIFVCLVVTALGNLFMFFSGFGYSKGAMTMMFLGRIIMGLGVGGIDSVVPVYSSELNEEGGRGKALAKEFQSNIFGLNMAFALNLLVTKLLGKSNQWAWRIPIIAMQIYPVLLLSFIYRLPETPRWFVFHDRKDDAKAALVDIYGEDEAQGKLDELVKASEEESESSVGYSDMIFPSGNSFHPTMVTVMGQVNQALTGYGAISVYGPQIFELLGFGVSNAEYLTLGNYISYFFLMTLAWMYIDVLGRRILMISGAAALAISFLILTVFGALAYNSENLGIPNLAVSIPGCIILYFATGMFGIGWLSEVWLIPTEIFPSTSRAQGAAISVVIWGLANFAVTLLTPIVFNNLKYWLFLIFAATNAFAMWWTWVYSPETGGRSFEENQSFFEDAKESGTWSVRKVNKGEFRHMPRSEKSNGENGESAPLLGSR
ncbi:general substrate transporter [Physcia stellaris]|nr:general substrate transporter [Physcia stellaris]